MKKQNKRLISMLLVLSMTSSILAACGKSKPALSASDIKNNPTSSNADSTSGTSTNNGSKNTKNNTTARGTDQVINYGDSLSDSYDANYTSVTNLVPVNSVECKTVPFYTNGETDVYEEDVYFFNDNSSVAYMSMDDFFAIYANMFSNYPTFNIDYGYSDDGFHAVRENGSETYIDMSDGSIYLYDYETFCLNPYAINGGDIVGNTLYFYDENGEIIVDEDDIPLTNLFAKYNNFRNFTRQGYSLLLTLSDYNIPVYQTDGQCFLPVTTLSDFFLTQYDGMSLFYNNDKLFYIYGDKLDTEQEIVDGKTFADLYYEDSTTERSPELAEFTYNELCLFLNGNYGLKDEHNIGDSFDEYFESIGLKDQLLSTDGYEFLVAMNKLVMGYLADFHCGITGPGPYAGRDADPTSDEISNIAKNYYLNSQTEELYGSARRESNVVDGDGKPVPYMEIGNTAYITFDEFKIAADQSLYYTDDYLNNIEDYIGDDTLSLISYANRQITRANSPIKNIVIDISNNHGGEADAAAFVISWILGGCSLSIENPKMEGQYTTYVEADVNFDKYITDEDHIDLSKYRVFCLTSGLSFSCGNLVPAMLKESGFTTIIGRPSGGGACTVLPCTLADGTRFQISSNYKLCTVVNGSYYPIDHGVEPDFVIGDTKHYYDRRWLTDYVNQLP